MLDSDIEKKIKNKIIKDQLNKVINADLNNFDESTYTFYIKQKISIKIEENKCYLIKLKPTLFRNQALATNWNNSSIPKVDYLKVDVIKLMGNMIKVMGVGYDFEKKLDQNYFWNGWLTLTDIEPIQRL